jgi:hypothetical protein
MSTFENTELDSTSRSDLIARAEALGIEKADVLTRAELIDEIVKRSVVDPLERRLARGLLGVARDLVARVVERGLHLPDAAALIRGLQQSTLTPVTPPIATVTLAEIYAGQGHRDRALAVLDEVLEKEPDHGAARSLREKVATLSGHPIAAESPSEPPPQAVASAEPRLVREEEVEGPLAPGDDLDADDDELPPDSDRSTDDELRVAAQRDADERDADESDPEGAPGRIRDTLPPEPDFTPTIAPDDRPATTLRAAPRDSIFADVRARPTEIAPPWPEDVDRLVLLPIDATSALARWELRPGALDEARVRAEGGGPIVRIVAVTPSWDGPTVEVRDIEIAQPTGDWWVCELPPGAVLRAAVGWRSVVGFDPLAVALEVVTQGAEASGVSPRGSVMTGSSMSDDGIEVRARPRADEGRPGERAASEMAASMIDEGIEVRARQRAGEGRPGEGSASSSWRALAFAPGEAPYQASP